MFEEVVRRYAGMVFSVCLRTCRDAHDAEDATQAVFLALAVQCKSGNTVRHLPAWLRQVAKRTSLDVRKSRKRREAREARRRSENRGIVGEGDDGRPDPMDLRDLGHLLSEELAKLPAKYRLPLVSLYFGGLSREEIAEQLGLKPGALGVRLHRARAMLGDRLKRRGAVTDGLVLSGGVAPLLEQAFGGALTARTVDAAARLMLGHDLSGAVSANVLALMNGTYGAIAIGKVKLIASVLLLLSTLTGGGVAVAAVGAGDAVPQVVAQVRQWLDRVRFEFHLPRLDLRADARGATADPVPLPRTAYVSQPIEPQLASPVALPGDVAMTPPVPVQAPPIVTASRLVGSSQQPRTQASKFPLTTADAPAPLPRRSTVTGREPDAATAPSAAAFAARATAQPAVGADGPAPVARTMAAARLPGYGTGAVRVSNRPAPGSPFLASVTGRRTRGQVAGPTLAVGATAGTVGTYTLAGGTLVTAVQDIGRAGAGTFVQVGGENVTAQLLLGEAAGGRGTYQLTGGTLRLSSAGLGGGGGGAPVGLVVGGAGEGALYMGDALAAGQVVGDRAVRGSFDADAGPVIIVRADAAGAGTIRGWGRIEAAGGTFINNGQVTADGYGDDRELALTGLASIGNAIDNPADGGTNGWFAQHGGQLTMPALAHAEQPNRFTWGEGQHDDVLDLVNSVRLVIEPPPEIVTVSLLALDRSGIPALPAGHHFVGLWSLDTGATQPHSIDLSVRYDDGLAAAGGLDEAGLKLWRFAGGEWSLVTGPGLWRDVDANLIGGRTDALQYFAVSAPEPGGITVLAIAGATALLRRRRRG